MDASEILVAVMIAAAVVWLVWAELHSRRNQRASQTLAESAGSRSLDKSEMPASSRQVKA